MESNGSLRTPNFQFAHIQKHQISCLTALDFSISTQRTQGQIDRGKKNPAEAGLGFLTSKVIKSDVFLRDT